MYEGEGEKTAARCAGCQSFDLELAAYLEGEERPELVAHMRECSFCYSMLADLEGIRSAGGELALEEPPKRIWTNIRASLIAEGIIRQPEAFWRRWLESWHWLHNPVAVAALGCLMVLGIGLVRVPWVRTSGSHTPPRVDLSDVASAAAAVGPMETSYHAQAASFEPSVKETYQKSLDSLDGEIRECLNSVRQEPDNSLAREYLLAAYQQKAYVLQSALYVEGR
jgi:hypothetical protein